MDPCVRFPVLCAGLPRSASTWAFNVAAGLAEADNRWSQVTRLYSDDGLDDAAGTRMAEPGLVLIKTHAPSAMLRCAFAWSGAPVMLTVRDPRDSAASLMQQFGFAFEDAVRAVSSSAAALLQLVSVCRPLVLRYEDGFAADPGSVAQVGEFLGLSVAERVRDQIWRELSSEHVSRRLAVMAFSEAPEGALALPAADPETHWHPNHIGDGLIGKYRTVLTAAQIAVVEYEVGPFMRHFGYPVAALPRGLTSGARVDFSAEGVGASYLGGGFSRIEGWGVWTDGEVASFRLPLERPVSGGMSLELDCLLAPVFGMDSGSRAAIWVNGRRQTVIAGRVGRGGPEPLRVVLCWGDGSMVGADGVQVELRLSGLRGPRGAGGRDDARLLGVGLRAAVLVYE